MSTLAIAPRAPRPLGQSRVRGALCPASLSTVNRLNAAPRSTPLKRSIVYNSDEENIAPSSFSNLDSTKRKRASEDDEQLFESPKAAKTTYMSSATELNKTVQVSTPRKTGVAIGKPAGRSPVAKSTRAFGRRSQRTPLGRLAQAPTPVIKTPAPRPSRQPASWFFDIHVDTVDEEASNTIQHFAGRLDISDDDDGAKTKVDDRGKENIPPHELGIVMPPAPEPLVSTPRHGKNMMTASRSPLSELKPSDYYPADLKGLFTTVFVDDDESSTPGTRPQGPSSNGSAASQSTQPKSVNTEAVPPSVAESESVAQDATASTNIATIATTMCAA